MRNKIGGGSYRGVDLVESLNHKSYHNFYRKSYRLPAWHYPTVGNDPRAITMLKWKDLLVICKVLAMEVLEIVRAAGAIDLLEIDGVAGAIKLAEMGSVAGNLPGFSYRIAGN